MLMTDNTGWNDFGPYSGEGLALGQKPPKVASGSGDGLTA
jgi:arylsulfatase